MDPEQIVRWLLTLGGVVAGIELGLAFLLRGADEAGPE